MKVNIRSYESKAKDSIYIEPFDIWNLDMTLSKIILKALKYYKKNTHGIFKIDNTDVPKYLQSEETHCKCKMDYVLDEMIWAHKKIVKDSYFLDREEERIQNGLRLFGKYYRGLWD